MSDNIKAKEQLRNVAAELLWEMETDFESHKKLVESPIEEILLAQFVARRFQYDCVILGAGELQRFQDLWRYRDNRDRNYGFRIYPQAAVAGFRLDFLLVVSQPLHEKSFETKLICVECDGHNFHERTKEQAQRDRSRDRELQRLGYLVVRFTGSELYRDAGKCFDEIVDLVFQ